MRVVNEKELIMRCFSCIHAGQETSSDVSFCNVCGEYVDKDAEPGMVYECYEPDNDCANCTGADCSNWIYCHK